MGTVGAAAAFVPSLRGLTSDSIERPSDAASQDPTHGWLLETKGISRAIEAEPAGGLRLKSSKNLKTSHEWVVPSYADFAFASSHSEFEGLSPRSGFRLADKQTQKTEKNATELRLDFISQDNRLKLSLFYASFPDTSVIEQWCRLENIGTQTIAGISRFDPIFFTLHGHTEEFQVRVFSRGQYTLENWPIEQKLEIRGAMEFCARDGSEAVVFAFRNGSTQSAYRLLLKGLQRTAHYRVKSVNHQTESNRPGAELVDGRIVIDLPKGDMSEVLIVKRV